MLNFLWIVIVFQFHLLQTTLNQDLFNKNGSPPSATHNGCPIVSHACVDCPYCNLGGKQLKNCTRMAENGLFIPIPRTDGTCVGIGEHSLSSTIYPTFCQLFNRMIPFQSPSLSSS